MHAETYPHVWLEGIGRSHEGRQMYAVRICFKNCKHNKVIFVEIGTSQILQLITVE